jgi:hypothetical protein
MGFSAKAQQINAMIPIPNEKNRWTEGHGRKLRILIPSSKVDTDRLI